MLRGRARKWRGLRRRRRWWTRSQQQMCVCLPACVFECVCNVRIINRKPAHASEQVRTWAKSLCTFHRCLCVCLHRFVSFRCDVRCLASVVLHYTHSFRVGRECARIVCPGSLCVPDGLCVCVCMRCWYIIVWRSRALASMPSVAGPPSVPPSERTLSARRAMLGKLNTRAPFTTLSRCECGCDIFLFDCL